MESRMNIMTIVLSRFVDLLVPQSFDTVQAYNFECKETPKEEKRNCHNASIETNGTRSTPCPSS